MYITYYHHHSLFPTDLDSTVYTTKPENYDSYFCRDNSGTDHGRFFNNPNYDTTLLSEHKYSLYGPRDTPLSSGAQPPDAIYDAVTETSDGKDHTQEVGGVGLYSTYDVITTDIDHRDENNTEEAAPYLVVAKSQKEGDHTEEEEAALYSVVTEPQDIRQYQKNIQSFIIEI